MTNLSLKALAGLLLLSLWTATLLVGTSYTFSIPTIWFGILIIVSILYMIGISI